MQFLPNNAHNFALLFTINPILLENILYHGKRLILGTFICLGTMWICGHFSTPKIGFWTKKNFFHAWVYSGRTHPPPIKLTFLMDFENSFYRGIYTNMNPTDKGLAFKHFFLNQEFCQKSAKISISLFGPPQLNLDHNRKTQIYRVVSGPSNVRRRWAYAR